MSSQSEGLASLQEQDLTAVEVLGVLKKGLSQYLMNLAHSWDQDFMLFRLISRWLYHGPTS